MTSSLANSHKNLKRMESRNKHSWGWDSHISPKNSKWLAENLQEMDLSVKRMLKLLEEEGDSFAKKAEMYYQKRPQLAAHVEEFYRMYRSLAERYDNVTGELRKNVPSDLRSQGSCISDVGSEPPTTTIPSPDHPLGRRRAAAGSSSDLGTTKEGDETSTLDSESESDDSSVNNYSANGNKKIAELEAEIRKLQTQQEELRVAEEKVRFSENVIAKLRIKLRRYESPEYPQEDVETLRLNDEDFLEQERRIHALEEDLKATREKLVDSEEAVQGLRRERENDGSAQKDVSLWKSKFEKEKREVSRLQDRISRYKANLSDREREIRGLNETVSNANKSLSEENVRLEDQVKKLSKERAFLDDSIKEWDLRCQCLEEDLRRMRIRRIEMEGEIEQLKVENACIKELETERDTLVVKVLELDEKMGSKDEEIERVNRDSEELRRRCEQVEREVERGAEEKREAIRQLCFSLDHYRSEYQMLRRALVGRNKGRPVLAS